jgi:hypothetical protein
VLTLCQHQFHCIGNHFICGYCHETTPDGGRQQSHGNPARSASLPLKSARVVIPGLGRRGRVPTKARTDSCVPAKWTESRVHATDLFLQLPFDSAPDAVAPALQAINHVGPSCTHGA